MASENQRTDFGGCASVSALDLDDDAVVSTGRQLRCRLPFKAGLRLGRLETTVQDEGQEGNAPLRSR